MIKPFVFSDRIKTYYNVNKQQSLLFVKSTKNSGEPTFFFYRPRKTKTNRPTDP